MTKAVFFDLYNTLIHYNPPREESLSNTLKSVGVSAKPSDLVKPFSVADEFFYAQNSITPVSKLSREEQFSFYKEYQRRLLEQIGVESNDDMLSKIVLSWAKYKYTHVLFEDVKPAFEAIKDLNVSLGLISNIDKDISPLLKELGIYDKFEIIVTSLEAGFCKPSPEIFHFACNKAGIKPEEAVFVGDQYNVDVIGASNAGMRGMLIDRTNCHQESNEHPRLRSLKEIAGYL